MNLSTTVQKAGNQIKVLTSSFEPKLHIGISSVCIYFPCDGKQNEESVKILPMQDTYIQTYYGFTEIIQVFVKFDGFIGFYFDRPVP